MVALAVIAVAVTPGCQSRDVGDPCQPVLSPTEPAACTDPTTDTADFFESSATNNCENLICIHSAGEGCTESSPKTLLGLCSKPCVSDSDCFPDETHMVCRRVVLSEAFINWLRENNPAALERYLQDIQFSSYCALPASS